MIPILKNVYIDIVDDIVNKHNNTYYKTIKMKPVYVKLHLRIPKYKKKFSIRLPSKLAWRSLFLWLKIVKNIVPWTYSISDFKGKGIVGTFYEKELQETNQREFRVEKVIKGKGDKLYEMERNRKAMIVLLIIGLIKKA